MKRFLNKETGASLPLVILAGVMPLVVYFTVEKIPFAVLPWFPNRETWMDLFLNGKSMVLLLAGIWMAAVLLYRRLRGRRMRLSAGCLFLYLLGGLELLSAFRSTYPEYSFFGMIEQYESVWVLLAYLVTTLYAREYMESGGNLKPILLALAVSAGILCIPGLTQLCQHDIWETALGKMILVPEAYVQFRDQLRTSDTGRQMVYMTLYNPDYAGIFLVMISPVLWLWNTKVTRLLAVAAGICLIGTGSGTAWVGAGVILLLGCLMSPSEGKRRYGKGLLAGAALILTVGAVLWNTAGNGNSMKQPILLEEVHTEADAVCLTYAQQEIRLGYTIDEETGGVVQEIRYADGTKVPVVWADDRGECDPKEEGLAGLQFKVYEKDGINYVQFRCEDVVFRFTDSLGTGRFEYITLNGKVDELAAADTAGLLPDSFLNGRGYIWNRVLPLILKHPLLGSGPDTFMLTFPQNDYVAKAALGGNFFQSLITNAHSLYLQMAVQTGIPSVIFLLLFAGIYLWDSWKLFRGRKTYTWEEKMGKALFLGVCGYLICGLTWVSSVCTTPFFWLFVGLGIAVNDRLNGKSYRKYR